MCLVLVQCHSDGGAVYAPIAAKRLRHHQTQQHLFFMFKSIQIFKIRLLESHIFHYIYEFATAVLCFVDD